MARRRAAQKRQVVPDPVFKSALVTKFVNNVMLDGTIKLYNDKRDVLEQHLVSNELSDHVRKKSFKYIASFYEIVNDPAKRQRYILEKCIGS